MAKAVISTTYDNKYLWYLPLTVWTWNRLGVDVICFMPEPNNYERLMKFNLVMNTMIKNNIYPKDGFYHFKAPEHKEATYAQCSRLYAASLDLPENEVLVTSDVDMIIFAKDYISQKESDFDIFGSDLVPEKQYPICYISASVKAWRDAMKINGETYQECLDDLLGNIEAEHFRGNYWGKDQETAYQRISSAPVTISHHFRAREGTQFASRRYDRDNAYLLERLSPDTIDYHMNRPGYEEHNFDIIMKVLKYHYPDEDFGWLINYREEYLKLL